MKRIIPVMVAVILAATVVHPALSAEEIRNYGQCPVCPGNIHISQDQARELLGRKAMALISGIDPQKSMSIQIDLDGAMKPVHSTEVKEGFDLHITAHRHIIYIKSLVDNSYIQIVSPGQAARNTSLMLDWHPEVYLQSAGDDRIDLKDTKDTAWQRMAESHIYAWVFKGDDGERDGEKFQKQVAYALSLLK